MLPISHTLRTRAFTYTVRLECILGLPIATLASTQRVSWPRNVCKQTLISTVRPSSSSLAIISSVVRPSVVHCLASAEWYARWCSTNSYPTCGIPKSVSVATSYVAALYRWVGWFVGVFDKSKNNLYVYICGVHSNGISRTCREGR